MELINKTSHPEINLLVYSPNSISVFSTVTFDEPTEVDIMPLINIMSLLKSNSGGKGSIQLITKELNTTKKDLLKNLIFLIFSLAILYKITIEKEKKGFLKKNCSFIFMNKLNPLDNIDDWDDDILKRYPEKTTYKTKKEFRDYQNSNRAKTVREFYKLNHQYQSFEFVSKKEDRFLKFNERKMSIWDAVEFLNTLVDDSDPDIELDQLQHLLQTSEAIRSDGHPDWFVLTGFLHDVGKVLCLFGEPQWAVVGDTFPVGCSFSKSIVHSEYFLLNPDSSNPNYNSKYGIYKENCGLDNVKMSWGHDEYLYQIVKDYLPQESLYMIRYHSFYSQHKENAYNHLLNELDIKMFEWVKKFNKYDLYSKAPIPPDSKALRPYYEDLVSKYLPNTLNF